ncbi:hypothetical protein Syun_031103 [Stephania yunnanensis]|uniref:RNase H type-1 domain-containing protein n=1 Tax=Stephania yunnanensis TaxID=152371 RepID=A0AAP0E1Y7_9MAGN
MYDMNRSFIMKLGWELITNPKALWVKLMRAKYGIPDDTIPYELTPGKCSHAWWNICKIWSRLLEGLNWAIGNGHTIRFWLDRWVGGVKPLIELTTIPILESRRGDTLCTYVNEFGGWCWADFEAYLPAEVLLRIAAIPPPIPQSSDEDSVYWSHSESGKFSTYSAYTSLTHMPWSVGNAGWKMIWKCAVPERVRTFLWLAFNDALLTNEVRHRRHMIDFDGCDQCGGDSESLNHILRECPRSVLLWGHFLSIEQLGSLPTLPLQEWLVKNLMCGTKIIGVEWSIFFATTCWLLWNTRNRIVIGEETVSHMELCHMITAKAKSFQQANDFFTSLKHDSPSKEHLIGWHCPPEHWVKVNTDGALKEEPFGASAGGIIRNAYGDWIGGFVVNIGKTSVFGAELWGALQGLQLAWDMGFRQIVLELDNKSVVELLNGEKIPLNQHRHIVSLIRQLLQRRWFIRIVHIHREGNRAADWLASMQRITRWEVTSLNIAHRHYLGY